MLSRSAADHIVLFVQTARTHFFKLLFLLLILIFTIEAHANNQTEVFSLGLIPSVPKTPPQADKILTKALRRAPISADNSTGLPPVGDQGAQGSCASWASGYYMKSYQEGQERAWDLNTSDHQFSPAFLYNQLQYYDDGTSFEDNFTKIANHGCATLSDMPYDDADHLTWPTADQYKNAIPYRADSYSYIGSGETPGVFAAVKTVLAAGNLCVVGIPIYRPDLSTRGHFEDLNSSDYEYDLPAAEDDTLAGYHALTIVGYDESRFGGGGGYKIVNSWGTVWGDNGFAWIAESFLNSYGFDFYSMTDKIGYIPTAFSHWKVTHEHWSYDNITVTVGVGSISSPTWSKEMISGVSRNEIAIDMWFDVSDASTYLPPDSNNRWWLSVSDQAEYDPVTILTFEIDDNTTVYSPNLQLPRTAGGAPSEAIFISLPEYTSFYVNDTYNPAEDIYCTAEGDDANDGLTPGTPKASIQSILKIYNHGATVYVDTGEYVLTENIQINPSHGGDEDQNFILTGSTHPNGTRISRNNTSTSSYAFDLYYADFIEIKNCIITNSYIGIGLQYSDHCNISGCRIYGNADTGIDGRFSYYTIFQNCLIDHNGDDGIDLYESKHIQIINNTIIQNRDDQVYISTYADVEALRNNIIWADGSGDYCIYVLSSGSISASDYNNLNATSGGLVGYYSGTKATLTDWQTGTGKDAHSLGNDPVFVDIDGADNIAGNEDDDLHLQSTEGSWHKGAWTADAGDSPCIDAGYPADEVGDEPVFNGNRINIGAFGGTAQASLSLTGRYIEIITPEPGSTVKGDCLIQWELIGDLWLEADTLELYYSSNSGADWILVSDSIYADRGEYVWDLIDIDRGGQFRIRLVCQQDSSVSTENQADFTIGGTRYYVNDTYDAGNDIYCTASGADANDGLTSSNPKDTIQGIIDAYDLEPGDIVYVDTGNYVLSANIAILGGDRGDASYPVTFRGSPHPVGTIINRNSTVTTSNAFDIDHAGYITLDNFHVKNAYYGIRLYFSDYCIVSGCRLYNNANDGIYAYYSNYATFRNNEIDRNGDDGVCLNHSSYAQIINNTIVQNTDDQVYMESSYYLNLENNIFWADGSGDYCIYSAFISGISTSDSDYNNLYATNGALVGYGYSTYASLSDWQAGTGKDIHSINFNPLFVDSDGADNIAANEDDDFHLQSTAGSWHDGTWAADSGYSPCIDAGDTLVSFSYEPFLNGGRINIGAYGDTAQASKTIAGREISLLSPNGSEVLEGMQDITWHCFGNDWESGDTLQIEYSSDGGVIWNIVTGADALDYESGSFSWDTSTASPDSGHFYQIRIICNQDGSATDNSDGFFLLHNQSIFYYVNDVYDPVTDVYCTAVGDDANDGLTSATPKATIQALIDAYNLEPGDVVYVDTGNYVLTTNIEIGIDDAGSASSQVIFQGSTHPGGTIINRNDTGSLSYSFHVDQADYISLENFNIKGAYIGIKFDDSDNCNVINSRIYTNSLSGIYSDLSNFLNIKNNVIDHNGDEGIYLSYSDAAQIINNTIVQNTDDQVYTGTSTDNLILKNNIIWADGSGDYCIYRSSGSISGSDYNTLYVTNNARIGYYPGTYYTLNAWQTGTGFDADSLSSNPLLVDMDGADNIAGNEDDDFHLQSAAGSWHDGIWAVDAEYSPCIDAGDLLDAFGNEPSPNGGRINIGAYGDTGQASKSQAGRRILLLSPNGSEMWGGTQNITWHCFGDSWLSGDTLQIEYSSDGGSIWNIITGADALNYESGTFSWDTSTASPDTGHFYQIRITCNQDGSATDNSDDVFMLHNQGISYYVNDEYSASSDVYCNVDGDNANDGLSPDTPKATIQAIIAAYDLESGDMVYVDSGDYMLTSNIEIKADDGGDASFPVTFCGSTHPDGTRINRNDTGITSYAFRIDHADYVSLENFKIKGARIGISLYYSGYCAISNSRMYNNSFCGIHAAYSDHSNIQNNVIDHNGDDGIYLAYSGYALITNNTVVQNTDDQIYLGTSASNVTLKNNIIWAAGSGDYCIYRSSGGISASDYNNLYVSNDALVGYYSGTYPTLADWKTGTNMDAHSLGNDPAFVDDDGADDIAGSEDDDFHLQSTEGSWHSGAWSADASDSLCIDAGDPLDAISNEPSPNGGRINMGAFGGTDQASLSTGVSDRIMFLLNPEGGVAAKGECHVQWSLTGNGWQPGDTLTLYYSPNNGIDWYPIPGGSSISAGNCTYIWDLCGMDWGDEYLLRIECDQDLAVWLESGSFSLSGMYYVNDSSANGDEYTSSIGDNTNDGKSPTTPKDTIQGVLEAYDLEPGDTVFVDSGTYDITGNLAILSEDEGSSEGNTKIKGIRGKTVLENGNISLKGDFLTIEKIALPNNSLIISNKYDGYQRLVSHCNLLNNFIGGSISLDGSPGNTPPVLTIQGNIVNRIYFWVDYGDDMDCTITNNTIISDNNHGIYIYSSGGFIIKNNVIHTSGTGKHCIHATSHAIDYCDYNNLYATDGAGVGYLYVMDSYPEIFLSAEVLDEWWSVSGFDNNSISSDPKFADPDNHDYHLRSTEGRWDPTASGGAGDWLVDSVNSPCIDTGNPADEVGDEVSPNGAQIDIGAYGGTSEASKSPSSDRWLIFRSAGDSEYLHAWDRICWTPMGSSWTSGETIRIEYSSDSGGSWQQLSGAEALEYDLECFWVNTATLPNGPQYRFRVAANSGEATSDTCDRDYMIKNPPSDDNYAPTISDITDQSTDVGTSTDPIAFSIWDTETPAADLTVSGGSSNTTLVPIENIVFAGTGPDRTVTITPAAGETGSAVITVTVDDGTDISDDTFTLSVAPIVIPGDVNNDGALDLADVILVLQIIAGIEPVQDVNAAADVNGDGRIGIEEAIYILENTTGLR